MSKHWNIIEENSERLILAARLHYHVIPCSLLFPALSVLLYFTANNLLDTSDHSRQTINFYMGLLILSGILMVIFLVIIFEYIDKKFIILDKAKLRVIIRQNFIGFIRTRQVKFDNITSIKTTHYKSENEQGTYVPEQFYLKLKSGVPFHLCGPRTKEDVQFLISIFEKHVGIPHENED